MTDNIIKSDDVNQKPVKKATPKKTAAKKADAPKVATKDGLRVIVFESGASYTSNGISFTRENRIQAVPEADAERLLELDNFRLPSQEEVDNYFASMED